MTSEIIDKKVGARVFFKCEHLQKTGSFKARGALNSAVLAKENNAKGVYSTLYSLKQIAHSSGNHGQALAWSALKIGVPCTIVVPKNAPSAKIDGMREYQANIVFCEPTMESRESICAELAEKDDKLYVDPHNCVSMINGHASIVFEILDQVGEHIDSIFISVGGGGFASSVAFLIGTLRPDIEVYLVAPEQKELSNLLENGVQCSVSTLNTMADGVRVAHVGSLCEPILRKFCKKRVLNVKEEEIKDALKLIWTRMKQRVEPTAALAFAGVLYHKPNHIKCPLVVLCGGNVDADYIIN
uniref:Serine racemase n=1 Tax=Caenorhabditis tropicalis TaxID=1561998 RepID=A0A1I7UXX7_9PELO